MVTGKNEWWKRALLKKYFSGYRRRCLDAPPSRQSGSPIWKLLWASFPLLQQSLYWVLGNGKLINIWTDGILGSRPLCQDPSLDSLKQWLLDQQKHTLYDILIWNSNGAWQGWNLGNLPQHLSHQTQDLFLALKGAALVHLQIQDNKGWGAKGYSVKEGYRVLLQQNTLPVKYSWWRNIWSNDGLPKINIFC